MIAVGPNMDVSHIQLTNIILYPVTFSKKKKKLLLPESQNSFDQKHAATN